MSKSVEEVRRGMFQSWVETFNSMPAALFVDERGRYIDDWIQCRWLGFNAALDAVEIELPKPEISYDVFDNGHAAGVDCCRAAIEQTGLGLRVL